MTPEEERLRKLEERVKNFKIVSSGSNQVQGGFPEFKPKESFEERIKHLEELHQDFRLSGSTPHVTVQGSFETGIAICATCPPEQTGSIPIGVPPAPPSETGACCYDDGGCDVLSESDCTAAEGIWQGSGTTCEETECTGACCNGTDCATDMTKADCESGGGTFQGIGSDCDPNPCGGDTGACCYDADGSCVGGLTGTECSGSGGVFWGGASCDDGPCVAACCLNDGTCGVTTQFNCEITLESAWLGYFGIVDCDPNPCINCSGLSYPAFPCYLPDPLFAHCCGSISELFPYGSQCCGSGQCCIPDSPISATECCFGSDGESRCCSVDSEICCDGICCNASLEECIDGICTLRPGACCIDSVCFPDMTVTDCEEAGGSFQGGDCDPDPC